jgi:hypothetical protein
MSDVCTGTLTVDAFEFDDLGSPMNTDSTPCSALFYQPTNSGSGDTFPTLPAGAQPYSTLSAFNGIPAKGTWRLHINDDLGADTGVLRSASIKFQTVVDPALGYTYLGNESTHVLPKSVTGARPITDVNVTLHELSLGRPSTFDGFLQSPAGTVTTLMSDACGGSELNGAEVTFDDQAS